MADQRPRKRHVNKKEEPAPAPVTAKKKSAALDFQVELPSRRWLTNAANGKGTPPRLAASGG